MVDLLITFFQTAENLAKAGRASTEAERQKAGDELAMMRNQENAKKKVMRNKIMSRYVVNDHTR